MMDMINQIMLMKNIAIAGGFMVLAVYGAGALSVDARRGEVLSHPSSRTDMSRPTGPDRSIRAFFMAASPLQFS